MAPAREENTYEGNLGTGGKFRKRRVTQSKPYDRPSTALRNQNASSSIGSSNGWIAKLVDPAQRLISASAQRLFGSVSRKRLTQPPPPQREPDAPAEPPELHQDGGDQYRDAVSSPKIGAQEVITGDDTTNNSSDGGGFTELEQILRQKTFTRSEVDRLTALLHSKTVDMPVENEAERSKALASIGEKDRFENTPLPTQEKRDEINLTPTAAVSRSVIDEDVASPAELAKAYMGSRASKVSPSKLGLRSQAIKDNPSLLGIQYFPQKSPRMALMPRSAVHAGVSNNGILTSRTRGRSAIYGMNRTPYSRANLTSSSKGSALALGNNAGPSLPSVSALPIWEQNQLSASQQGSSKRRSSAVESDIWSGGPIRRTRQKLNLLSSTNLRQPITGSSFSLPRSMIGADAQQDSVILKSHLATELNDNLPKMFKENVDNSTAGPSSTPVPSRSSEMASKILQQLDKLVSPKEKSPTKLPPSMLSGPACRSLENVDSMKCMESGQYDQISTGPSNTYLGGVHNSSPQMQEKPKENGQKVSDGHPDRDVLHHANSADRVVMRLSSGYPQKNQAFQMSAHEGSFDVDCGYANGVASSPPVEGKGKQKVSEGGINIINMEAIAMEKHPSATDIKFPASSVTGSSGGTVAGKLNSGFIFPSASAAGSAVPAVLSRQPNPKSDATVPVTELSPAKPVFRFGDKVETSKEPNAVSPPPTFSFGDNLAPPSEVNASPVFSFGQKVASLTEAQTTTPMFSFGSKDKDKAPELSFTSATSVTGFWVPKASATLKSKIENSNSLGVAVARETDDVAEGHESEKGDNKKMMTSSVSAFSSSLSTPTSTAGIFPFGASNNGSPATVASLSYLVSHNITSASSSPSTTSTSGNIASFIATTGCSFPASSASPFSSVPVMKFGSATASPSTHSTASTSTSAEAEAKINQSTTSFGVAPSSPFGNIPAVASTGGSIFGFNGPAALSSSSNLSQGSTVFATGNAVVTSSNANITPDTKVATATQSMPIQFGSSASLPSFGFGGNSSVSTSSSLFGSSQSSAFSSEANSVSSSSFNVTNASSQSAKIPTSGSIFNSSNGFAFGSSSISANTSVAVGFGSSAGSTSSSSFFSFTSSMPSTSSPPIFGSTSPVPAFGSTNSPRNDQVSMVDSMAEDTVRASAELPSTPVFGQQPVPPQPPAFVFGSTAPSSSNSFQFGSQQNSSAPQNPVPFQASGTLGFNAGGGSFSLGSGGGGGDKSKRKIIRVKRGRK